MRVQDVLIIVGDLGQLALKIADLGFEVVALSHLDGEKMVDVPLSFPLRCVLGEKRFGYLLEVVEKMRR